MKQAVLFDLDGTLFDREKALSEFVSGQHARTPALHHIPKAYYVARFVDLELNGQVWKDTVYQALVHELKISGVSWQELLADYILNFSTSVSPAADLIPALESLRSANYVLGIISNGRTQLQRSVIAALRIEPYFATILISEEEGVRKPDPEIFRRAAERLNVSIGECTFVGDHPVADVAGAKSAGMEAIWLRNSTWSPPESADGSINKLSDLESMLCKSKG